MDVFNDTLTSVIALAWNLYMSCSSASSEFKKISDYCLSIHITLKRIQHSTNEKNPSLAIDCIKYANDVQLVARNIEEALNQLDQILKSCRNRQFSRTDIHRRAKISVDDLDIIHSQLTNHLAALSTFTDGVQICTLGCIEDELDELLAAINRGEKEPSLLSEDLVDKPTLWLGLKNELVRDGITMDDLEAYRDRIIDYIRKLPSPEILSIASPVAPQESASAILDIPLRLPAKGTEGVEKMPASRHLNPTLFKDRTPSQITAPFLNKTQSPSTTESSSARGLSRISNAYRNIPTTSYEEPQIHSSGDNRPISPSASEFDTNAMKDAASPSAFNAVIDNDDLQAQFLDAACSDNAVKLLTCLQRGVEVDAPVIESRTALIHAADLGHSDAVLLLLTYGADSMCTDESGANALICASRTGHFKVVKCLLDHSRVSNEVQIGLRDRAKQSALDKAIISGHDAIAILLISRIFESNRAFRNMFQKHLDKYDDLNVSSPLTLAAHFGRSTVVDFLLKKLNFNYLPSDTKVALNCVDTSGRTALDTAFRRGDMRIVRSLVDNDASIDFTQSRSYANMPKASSEEGREHPRGSGFRLLRYISGSPYSLQLSLLHVAAQYADKVTMEYLISREKTIEPKDEYDITPVHVAVWTGNENTLLALIGAGAKIDQVSRWSLSPPLLAVLSGHEKIVKILLRNGADINKPHKGSKLISIPRYIFSGSGLLKNQRRDATSTRARINLNRRTALHLTVFTCNESMIRLLMTSGADHHAMDSYHWSPPNFALKMELWDLIPAFSDPKKGLSTADENGDTFLHIALLQPRCKYKAIEVLLSLGASVHIRDRYGKTPLFIAAENSDCPVEVARLLVDAGAHVDARCLNGNTPIQAAALVGNLPMITMLVDLGADPLCKNKLRRSLLHLIAESDLDVSQSDSQLSKVVNLLVDEGVDPFEECKERSTPLTLAKELNIKQTFYILEQCFKSCVPESQHWRLYS